ncbi:MAG TPA: transglycosylase SLT domain-containing protein [Terriglobia bacterium]|nr:transglycosylase SLT domain-containing protein [Terriglobia bacterium]
MLKRCAIAALLIFAFARADAGTATTQAPVAHSRPTLLVPPELRMLAARADTRPGWAPLERYAESARDRESKGLAYLALGYREYQAAAYGPALDHLERAAATGFSLADFAQYYRAAAAQQAGQPDIAAHALSEFKDLFPKSVLGIDATRLFAFCLIQSGQPEQAIRVLEAAPSLQKQPPLEYLLGQAYEKANKLTEAARALQDVYYQFATASEAAPSATLLKSIQLRLGANYPAPSEELRTTRAGALEKVGRLEAALDEYQSLLKDDPTAASSFAWRLGRDRCLIALGHTGEALADLSADGWPAGDIDAERILLMVRAHSRARDESAMLAALDQMARIHLGSSAYASALDSASFFFLRQVDWPRASTFGKTLTESCPNSELAEKAEWEVAWAAYLAGDTGEAQRRFLAYVGHHPSSFRIPAALYWLGRLDEAEHQLEGAVSVYKVLRQRYWSNYYSLRAAEREQSLAGPLAAHAKASDSSALESASLPPELRAIAEHAGSAADHNDDQARLCGSTPSNESERPALTLAALSLTDLAEHDLRLRLQEAAGSGETADLRLALARIERERQEYEAATYHAKRVVPNYANLDFDALPAEIWSLLYPEAFWDLVRRNAYANRLDPYLVMALVRQESGFDPKAVSGPGARGLMQLLPPTARELTRGPHGNRRHPRASGNLFDPGYNLRVGCRFFSEMIREFNGSLEQALAAYNAGPDRVKQWLNGHSFPEPAAFVESIPFPETRTYVQTVLRDQVVYRQLMAGKPRFKACGSRS